MTEHPQQQPLQPQSLQEDRAQSRLFEAFSRELLRQGNGIRFQARGASMSPAIRDGEMVCVKSAVLADLRVGDIVLVKSEMGFRLHRLVVVDLNQDVFITRGDCGQEDDPAVSGEEIVGMATAKEVRLGRGVVQAAFRGVGGFAVRCAARGEFLLKKIFGLRESGLNSNDNATYGSTQGPARARSVLSILSLLCLLLAAAHAQAQVAVDASTNSNAEFTGTGTKTLTFAHTTSAATNRLLIVGVSLNITNATGTGVIGITYNGVALNFIGAHNDAGLTRRVEMWYLLAPASGGPNNVIVSVSAPGTGNTVGIVAGATTFTGVDQTVPLGTFVSSDGANGANSQLDVPSVVNGMILDTLATGGNRTLTIPGPQNSEWNARSGNTATPDVRGSGTSRTGAPSVPISETFSGNSNWSLGAISVNPTSADIGVTTSVSAVALGQNSSYNITVTNNGPSAANNVLLVDTFAATNLSLSSVTPSAGTTCVTTGVITCTLPTSLASGASATIAIVVSTTAAGFYPNTATITDSGTPPDPNTGNNTYVALAPVVSIVCSATALTAGGTLSGVQNTYYPGTASVAKGATSIPVGTATGAGGTIAAGSLLLVIQMQDASINDSNTVAYGNGSTGSGFTAINNAGNYEFVKATGAISGGSVPISGAGSGSGLVFAYTSSADTATKGQSTYQVVLVPQYTSATLGSATATAWNGSTGGILALDVAGQLNLGSATVSVDGEGFRGGAGMQLTGGVAGATNTDFLQTSPAAYTGAAVNGIDAPKGEGVAGTPEWVQSGTSFLQTTGNYPSGIINVDGSMAAGAPGNAGGGGTDGDAGGNTENAGGGGGANGGSGGFGGDSWSVNLSSGGEGGSPFPATIDRIALGGGGGAGSRNNSDTDNQASGGAAGGGMIFIRAYNLAGTATLTANGAAAYNGTSNDAGGGGGGGGSIVILAANGGEGGLTLQANGGRGGDAWDSQSYSLADRHGPGGGGGGGVILVSGAPASSSVTGGTNGTTLTPGVAYGATPGTTGSVATAATLGQVTGIQSAALCTPDMTLSKSHTGNFTRGSAASYALPVSNVSPYGPTTGVVTLNDTLPTGITPLSATGTGWSCSVSAQTVSCVRSDVLAAASAYPTITLNANVSQSSPATIVNTATVAGGGEANLLNDTATDTASVVSSADLGVTDVASPDPVAAGSNITYTQIVTDNGPSAADNATAVIAIPANTTMVSFAAPTGWSCVTPGFGGTGNIICTNLSMPGLTAATFSLVVKVNTGTPNGTVISEKVSVASSAFDPNSANNTATATTIVGTTGPNLSVTNVASPNPVQAGNNITYTQVVTNTGSTAATGATFTEAAPANTTFVSVTPPAGWTCPGGVLPCTDASVAAGATGTFTVVYKVTAGTASGTTITDTATVNATNQSFGANSATATDIVSTAAQADLSLSTVATPLGDLSGNDITYTQTITNNGPATSTGVSFSEPIPTNTTYASVSAPVGWTCVVTTSVTCTNPSLASGATADIIVVVNVAASVAAGTITANSTVTATTSDPTAANNSTTVATPLTTACDLTVTNSGTPSPATAGNNIVYTQVVTNSGPSNCSTATFGEPLPNNTTFVSVAVVTTGGGTWTCPNASPVACTNPSVPPGSTATITATYKVVAGTAAGTIITDTATAGTTTRDTNPANNTVAIAIPVASATQADLNVTNSATPNPVTAGSNITYTQSVINSGPATAAAPVFTDTFPANTTAVSLTGPAGWTCVLATLKCTDTTTMAANATAMFTLVLTVNNGVASGTSITQTDSVTSTTGDPTTANNSATVSTLVADTAALSITNTDSPVPVQAGNNITYTQVITNAGPSAATTASLTETTPANTTFQSVTPAAGWTCTTPAVGSAGTITCTNPTFAPGTASFTVALKVTAGTAVGTAINETATVASAVTDPNSGNNSATAADVVATAAQADLVATNSATPASVSAGSNVTYTQSITNKGPAAATTTTFTQVTPPNTNFQSITPPAGWTCGTLPAVGGTGTITCTDGSNLAVNATANFTLVLQVNAGTPSGTSITETDTGNSSNLVAGSNSASATVIVANANSADMAIVKTATPNPVTEGTPLIYTLTVTNNGPASATNVTVVDVLPSAVTYLSSATTQGACSEANSTVTCLLGTMANAGTATISILTLPTTPGVISNTATVSADQTDPTTANNSSTQTETITFPTSITLQSFSAHLGADKNGARRVVLTWKTAGEAHNLGFSVYREQGGNQIRMNPSIVAGSALLMSGALPKHSGRSYAWIDASPGTTGASYWLEDIDVNGVRTTHGPVSVSTIPNAASDAPAAETRMLSQMNQAQPATGSVSSHIVENLPAQATPTTSQVQKQFKLAANPAVKIFVKHEGWYSVSQPDLVNAGLDPNVDPAYLRLYAEATEQPMQITGATAGPGGFGPNAAINFYGTGIDTVFSGTRLYWLVVGEAKGSRIVPMPPSSGSNQPPVNFPATVELKQRLIYFSALITQTGDNFFGAIVSPTPVEQVLQVPHLDLNSTQTARLEVVLQGVITGFPHDVKVALNGNPVGDVSFTGQAQGTLSVNLPPGLLQDWNNTVTLTAQNGDYDTSLVDHIRITYPHTYAADADQLEFTGRPGDELSVHGFTAAPTVLDITDPSRPVQLSPQISSNSGNYAISLQVPWTTTNPSATRHTLLAVGGDRVAFAAAVTPNHPSQWHSPQAGANIAMITYSEFAAALTPLVQAHKAEGKSSAVIPVSELYDEFNFGERTPFAIQQFLQSAVTNWKTPPTYLLLNGRASLDPRNYLGFGHLDMVPTRIIATSSLMTASDDWFSDFANTGMPTIPTGRLPVSTLDEANAVVSKIVSYESKSTNGAWTSQALMVADKDDTESFTQDTQTVQSQLPASMQATDVFAGVVGNAAAQQDIVNGINSGQLFVNYMGHGAEEQWSGSDIFDTNTVNSLTNQSQLPVFLIMDCLNGFFQDVYSQPLGSALLLAPNGGAVAVLASTGLNQPQPQTQLDKLVVQYVLSSARPTLGDSILKAKSYVGDASVRKTYVLFGDPAMQVKQPSAGPAAH